MDNNVTTNANKGLFREVMGRFATGVTVITTVVEGRVFGMTANAFMAGSLEPPLCVVSVSRSAHLHARLLEARRYGVSILSQEQQYLSNHFAGRRLLGVEPEFVYHNDVPVLRHATASITAHVRDAAECGDHSLFIGMIDFMQATSAVPILFYAGNYARIDRYAPIEEAEPPLFW